MIRLQTSLGRDIPNEQRAEFSQVEQNSVAILQERHPRAKVREATSGVYNCHGLTFATRRTRIPDSTSIRMIFADDKYQLINPTEVLEGDVVAYVDSHGDIVHSGVVISPSTETGPSVILSKWGYGPEVLHSVNDVPPVYRKARIEYYMCLL